MKGLLVIGLQHGAGEGAVAAAMSAVLRRAGLEPRLERPEELDPALLRETIAEGSEPVVAALGGGILGALTARTTLRDLAGELGLSVLLVAPAGPDAVNLVRLSLAAARAGRLTVAAVVLTGWPQAPDSVRLGERRLLGETAGVDVRTLPESPSDRADAVRDWPIEDWLTAPEPKPEPTPPRGSGPHIPHSAPSAAAVALEPYIAWEPQPVGDPRATPRPRIMAAMLEIVAAEGPIVASRACALYNRASGGKKLTTTARAPLSSAIHWLAQERKVVFEHEVVRLPDQPEVRVRELGDRVLEEVPLNEVAELMRRLELQDPDQLKRVVLTTYGLVRLTQRAEEYLDAALNQL